MARYSKMRGYARRAYGGTRTIVKRVRSRVNVTKSKPYKNLRMIVIALVAIIGAATYFKAMDWNKFKKMGKE